MEQALHPEHLEDLERSGLTPDTIRAAGIYTLTPGDIGKRLGVNDSGISSLLAFPYPGCDGFERYKCFYQKGESGPKYRQKTGTPNHLYFPPRLTWEEISTYWWWKARKNAWPYGRPVIRWWGSAAFGTGSRRGQMANLTPSPTWTWLTGAAR